MWILTSRRRLLPAHPLCTEALVATHRPSAPAGVYLNPNTGRFWTMDWHEGDQSDSLSLHKYLYGKANPPNILDPSGNEGIDSVWNVIPILNSFGFRASAKSLFSILHHVRTVTVQSYIAAASVWGFAGDNHGPTFEPSKNYRTTSTIMFEDSGRFPAKVTSDTGITRNLLTGASGQASTEGLKASMRLVGPGDIEVKMSGKARDPLTPQWATPPIAYNLRMRIDFGIGEFNGSFTHNVFPSFQIFVDNHHVYSYEESGGPTALFSTTTDLLLERSFDP